MNVNMTQGARGLLDLDAILDIVKNQELYQKRIDALKSAQEVNEASARKLTKAKDIDAALKRAKENEAKTEQALRHARDKAAAIIDGANAEAHSISRYANEDAERAEQAAAQSRNEKTRLDAEIATARATLKDIEQDAEDMKAKADKILQRARDKEAEIKEKAKKFADVLKLVNG